MKHLSIDTDNWDEEHPFTVILGDIHAGWREGRFARLDAFLGLDMKDTCIYRRGRMIIDGRAGNVLMYDKSQDRFLQTRQGR